MINLTWMEANNASLKMSQITRQLNSGESGSESKTQKKFNSIRGNSDKRPIASTWKNTFIGQGVKKGMFDTDVYNDYGRTHMRSDGLSSTGGTTAVSKRFSSAQKTSYKPFSLTGEKKNIKMQVASQFGARPAS